jgi:DNA-binding XRE family transcriptional regulator
MVIVLVIYDEVTKMKIKWEPAPPGIGWNRVKALRKKMDLNQTQVAAGADISIATLYNIEHGYEETTTIETKEKLAKFFECDVDDIFPAQMIGNETRAKYDLRKVRKSLRSHRLDMLKDFLPNLRFKDEAATAAVLDAMSLDELGDLFHSGLDEKDALDHLLRAVKKYGLAQPKVK